MAKGVVGINVGNHTTKVVEISKRGSSFAIKALGIAPSPEGAIVAGDIVQPEVVAQAIGELVSSAGIKGKNVVVSIGGQASVVVRVMDVPKMTKKELASSIGFEIERQVPYSADEIVSDFAILEEPDEIADGQNVPVLYAAARSDGVYNYVETLQLAKLNTKAIDVEALAVVRAIGSLSNGELPDVYAIINIGAESTEIAVAQGNKLVFPRIIPVGGNAFTDAVADTLGLDRAEAERVKMEQASALYGKPEAAYTPSVTQAVDTAPVATEDLGVPELGLTAQDEDVSDESVEVGLAELPVAGNIREAGKEQQAPTSDVNLDFIPDQAPTTPEATPIAEPPLPQELENTGMAGSGLETGGDVAFIAGAIQSSLAELAEEIGRSIEYYAGRAPGSQVAKIYLAGGGARLKGMDQFLQSQLGIPVEIADPLKYLDTSALENVYNDQLLGEMSPVLTVAIGLALRELV